MRSIEAAFGEGVVGGGGEGGLDVAAGGFFVGGGGADLLEFVTRILGRFEDIFGERTGTAEVAAAAAVEGQGVSVSWETPRVKGTIFGIAGGVLPRGCDWRGKMQRADPCTGKVAHALPDAKKLDDACSGRAAADEVGIVP